MCRYSIRSDPSTSAFSWMVTSKDYREQGRVCDGAGTFPMCNQVTAAVDDTGALPSRFR